MATELLDVERVRKVAEEKGIKLLWLTRRIGMSRNCGYIMFREGLLPKDPERKKKVLGELSKLLGIPVLELLVRLKRA